MSNLLPPWGTMGLSQPLVLILYLWSSLQGHSDSSLSFACWGSMVCANWTLGLVLRYQLQLHISPPQPHCRGFAGSPQSLSDGHLWAGSACHTAFALTTSCSGGCFLLLAPVEAPWSRPLTCVEHLVGVPGVGSNALNRLFPWSWRGMEHWYLQVFCYFGGEWDGY